MENEEEQDTRISQLVDFLEKTRDGPDAVVEYIDSLGGESGIVYGGMCFNKDFSMAHFLIMATLHIRGDGKKLTVQIESEKGILKAWNNGTDRQRAFLLAMELFIVKERRKGIARYDEVLRKLWENSIIGEDQVDWWISKENGLQEFYPDFDLDDAVSIRESGRRFLEWVQEGEED